MSTATLFDLVPGTKDGCYDVLITDELCVGGKGRQFMYGGSGIALAVSAMEQFTERELTWSTTQFLSFVRPGQHLEIEVTSPNVGRSFSQCHVVARVEGEDIFYALGSLGRPDLAYNHQWAEPSKWSDLPAPEDCPLAIPFKETFPDIHSALEARWVYGNWSSHNLGQLSQDGRVIFWVRHRDEFSFDATLLSLIGDYFPGTPGSAVGEPMYSTSLDNTIRVHRSDSDSTWVLYDSQIDDIHNGLASGRARIFSQEGIFLASASQTCVLRPPSK